VRFIRFADETNFVHPHRMHMEAISRFSSRDRAPLAGFGAKPFINTRSTRQRVRSFQFIRVQNEWTLLVIELLASCAPSSKQR